MAVNYRVKADQQPEGTNHADCLQFAEMHSITVVVRLEGWHSGKTTELYFIPKLC
jgi:hypothetical protein